MLYFLPISTLVLTVVAFFVLARGRFISFGRWQEVLRVVLALPLFVSGVGHFVRLEMFASIVPPIFPQREFLVILTGVFELAGGIGLQLSRSTRMASTCLGILMIAVFPANIYVANRVVGGLHMPSVLIRTGVQALYIVLLLASGWGIPSGHDA
ncbi:MAG: DoxX family membrane protein [Candidatus Korobacteraceae bacterium]